MSTPVILDFETFYSSKLKYSLKTQIAETYCRSEHFDPYLLAVYDGTTAWSGAPRDFNWASLEGKECWAHNSYFEESVVAEMQRRQWIPPFTPQSWNCTANLTSFLCNRRALAPAVEHLLGERMSKAVREDANGKHWKDFSATDRANMLEYIKKDVTYPYQLIEKFGSQWSPVERALSRLTVNQGRRGVKINRALLMEYIVNVHEMRANTEAIIPWIKESDDESWEDFNAKPTSTKCIAEQCRRSGIPCPPVKAENEEAYDEWEAKYSPQHPWILALGTWRSLNRLYKSFLVMKERLRSDDTMPFALLYFGAHTGRWSATAQINLQNPRKEPVFCNENGLMETNAKRISAAMKQHAKEGTWPEWVRHVIDFRALIIPRDGKKMIVSDLSQIEPRVLAWLSGDTKLLELLRGGMALYEAHARETMNWTGGLLKAENPKLYALAKARVLGLGYGAGWEKFITVAMTMGGVDITEEDPEFVDQICPITGQLTKVSGYGYNSKQTVEAFRTNNPKIVDLWRNLDESMKRSLGGDFVMTLPSGRKMRYEKVTMSKRMEVDPKTKKPKLKTVFTVGIGGKSVVTYGGKLTENLVQATARDVFGEHLVAMERNGWTNLFSAHDEAVLEVDPDITAKDVEHEMSRCPDWLEGCPIGAEAKEVPHYQK